MAKRRPSGDGIIRKREDGRWEGRIVVGHKDNRDPIFRYIYADTQKELTAKLRQNIDAYQGVELTEDSRMTLAEWLNRWLEQMALTIRPSTLDRYHSDIEHHVKPYLGHKKLTQITAADLRELYHTLQERGRISPRPGQSPGLSPATVHGIHTTLHQALQAAVEQGLMPGNPARQVEAPKILRKTMNILTEEQLKAFLAATDRDPVWRDFFYTELTTGLRLGEICGLTWGDFDRQKGTIRVSRTLRKENGGRLVAGDTKPYAGTRKILLPSSTAERLADRKNRSYSQRIFPNPLRLEAPLNPSTAYHQLKKILTEAGLPEIRFHDLRHTFATHALASGVDAKTLSGILGHTKASFTLDTYTHVTDAMRQSAADKIDRGIGRAEPKPMRESASRKPTPSTFQARKGQRRKPGTGCVSRINDHLWEGRYSPIINGQRTARNVYAKTEAECEEKLAILIREMKAEIAAGEGKQKQGALAS